MRKYNCLAGSILPSPPLSSLHSARQLSNCPHRRLPDPRDPATCRVNFVVRPMNNNKLDLGACSFCGNELAYYKMEIGWSKYAILVAVVGTLIGITISIGHLIYESERNRSLSYISGILLFAPLGIGVDIARRMKKKINCRCSKCKKMNILYKTVPRGTQGSL